MKKLLALMLAAALAFSLVACGGGEKDNSIQLTLDNYTQYLDVEVVSFGYNEHYFPFFIGTTKYDRYLCDTLGVNISVSGTSTNFNYNDVTLKAVVTVTYDCFPEDKTNVEKPASKETYEFNLEVLSTDIAGNSDVVEGAYELPECYMGRNCSSTFEVTEVTGTVTPS